MLLSLLLYFGVGIVSGLVASLFGLGGGLTVVPILFLTLPHLGIDHGQVMHMAVGTSLAVMIVTSLDTTYSHQKKGDILWPEVFKLAPYIALGALAASLSSQWIPHNALRYLFIGLLIFVILRALFKKGFTEDHALADFEPPGRLLCALYGFFTGCLAALLGIGGGPLNLPFLRRAKLRMVNAVSISATLAAPVALFGAVGYLIAGWGATGLPPWSSGYIYWPAVIGLAGGTLIGVPQGTKLSHQLDDRLEARLYIGLLIVTLIVMVV